MPGVGVPGSHVSMIKPALESKAFCFAPTKIKSHGFGAAVPQGRTDKLLLQLFAWVENQKFLNPHRLRDCLRKVEYLAASEPQKFTLQVGATAAGW